MAAAVGILASQAASAMTTQPYGRLANGQVVNRYELTNAHGLKVDFIDYGAIVTAIVTPDRRGQFANIVLGLPSLEAYLRYNGTYHFGGLIGRYANRIAGGRFTLEGKTYQVPVNDPPNALHGGPDGFDRRIWKVTPKEGAGGQAAVLTLKSPDGDQGFPGNLTVHVTYSLTDRNEFRIDYEATTDAPTVVNLTSHSYFNLGGNGSGSTDRDLVRIDASGITPTDAHGIPQGSIRSVKGTPFDLRRLTSIGPRLRSADPQIVQAKGFDMNFVIDRGNAAAGTAVAAALLHDPESGRTVRVATTQPGLQFYTGNGLDGSVVGSSGGTYRQGDGIALEAEHFPDSPNKPSFPSTELRPGQTFKATTIYRFEVDKYRPE